MFTSNNRIVPMQEETQNQNEYPNSNTRSEGSTNSAVPVAYIDEDRPVYIDPNVCFVDTTSLNTLPIATLQNNHACHDIDDQNNLNNDNMTSITIARDANLVADLSGTLNTSENKEQLTNTSEIGTVTSTDVSTLPIAHGHAINSENDGDSIAHAQVAYTITASRSLPNENDLERVEEQRLDHLIQSFLRGTSVSESVQHQLSQLPLREQEILSNSNYSPEQQLELARLAMQYNNSNSNSNRNTSDSHAVSGFNRVFAEESRANVPDDHFRLACFSLLFCFPCLPIALCSVYESCQVSVLHQQHRYSAANVASARAKMLALITIALGSIWWLIIIGGGVEEENKR